MFCYYLFVWVVVLFCFLVLASVSDQLISSTIVDLISWFSIKLEMSYFAFVFLFSLSLITVTVSWFGELYLGSDKQKPLFWMVLIGFVLGMAVLISTSDFLSLIVGWEILGITSYLLVAGYLSPLSSNGAMKTVLFNRIGDVFFVLVLSLVILKSSILFFLGVLLFAMCKSAQFPFSAWLPAAMAAPTPVSALVHSSTLVTAGLWVLLKLEVGGLLMLILGVGTMIIGAFCALVESDLKKVVAFSTLSQLGLLMVILSSFSFSNGLFHLLTHAFFKSMLFISIGFLILQSSHNQQGMSMNGSNIVISIMAWASLLSMSGALFFGGFFSKHAVLSQILSSNSSIFVSSTMIIGSTMTCLYSARLGNCLLKQTKASMNTTQQTGLLCCVLLGSAVTPKVMPFDTTFNLMETGVFSFLFLVWLYWSWTLLSESESITSIFFSSLVTTSKSKFFIVPSSLDQNIFFVRSAAQIMTNSDSAKLLMSLFLVSVVLFFLF